MTAVRVYTHQIPAEAVEEGSILVMHGMARYVTKDLGVRLGYRLLKFTTHRPDGSITSSGQTEIRLGSIVTVVCVTVDGEIIHATA